MSADVKTVKDLIQTLEDGTEGFAKGAEKLDSTKSPELAGALRRLSNERDELAAELRGVAASLGDDVAQHGTMAGTLHRGWMSLKDALSGSDPDGVLDAAEQGEDHAVNEYKKALDEDLSATVRAVVQRQCVQIQAARDEVRALRARHG